MLKTGTIRDALYSEITESPSTFTSATAAKSRPVGKPITSFPFAYLQFNGAETELESIGATRTYSVSESWGIVAVDTSEDNVDGHITNLMSALGDRTLGGEVFDVVIAGVTYEHTAEGETEVVLGNISIVVEYHTTKTD